MLNRKKKVPVVTNENATQSPKGWHRHKNARATTKEMGRMGKGSAKGGGGKGKNTRAVEWKGWKRVTST